MAAPSMTSSFLETEGVELEDVKWVSGAMYVAGADTVRLALAMCCQLFLNR